MIIKQSPEDFRVKEILNLKFSEGGYFYYLLKKKNWNTIDIVERLEKFFKTKAGFAGNKDKNAVTEQFISLFKISQKKAEKFKLNDVSLEFLGKGDKPISLGMLEGNFFEITLREVKEELPSVSFIENYFDEQRFGKNNALIGKFIVQRKFKEASKIIGKDVFSLSKRRLRFYLSAYQGYLFNEYLKEYIKEHFKEYVKDYVKVKYSLGELFFTKEFTKNFKISLVNFDTKSDGIYKKMLRREKIKQSDFFLREMPSLVDESVYRDAFAFVEQFSSKFFAKENKQIVSFYLQKGSYATVVIKKMLSSLEMFKYK